MDQDTAEGLARIHCGCGFEVVGEDQPSNLEAFDMHNCGFETVQPRPRWHESLFSDEGIITVLILAMAAIVIVLVLAGAS